MHCEPEFLNLKGTSGIDNPIHTRCLAPIDCSHCFVALCLTENDEPDPNKYVADPDPYSLSWNL